MESDQLKVRKRKAGETCLLVRDWERKRHEESLHPLQVVIFVLNGLNPTFSFWAKCKECLHFV